MINSQSLTEYSRSAPLFAMSIETAVKDAHVRKVCKGRQRFIRAAAVNHERAADILFFVIPQESRGNLIKRLQVRARRTHRLDV